MALLRAGLDVRVYEQAHSVCRRGPVRPDWTNCTGSSGRLGLLPAVARVGARLTAFEFAAVGAGRVLGPVSAW